jgi:protein TonB
MEYLKKNRMVLMMIGFSAVLHGLALACLSVGGTHAPAPVAETQFVSTVRMIKTAARPQQTAPAKPLEKKVVEKIVEIPPEIIPAEEETDNYEEAQEDYAAQESDTGNDEEARDDGGNGQESSAGEDGAVTDREYDALLAYIKDYINKNLVYPAMARRRNIEGIVGVSFEIDSTGAVSAITVYNSSGSQILDNAAVSLVKKIHQLKNMRIKRKLTLKVNIDYTLTG